MASISGTFLPNISSKLNNSAKLEILLIILENNL